MYPVPGWIPVLSLMIAWPGRSNGQSLPVSGPTPLDQEIPVTLGLDGSSGDLRFESPGQGVLRASLDPAPSARETLTEWLDRGGRLLRWNDLAIPVDPGQEVLFRMRPSPQAPANPTGARSFVLKVTFILEPFPGEPNGKQETAMELPIGKQVRFALFPRLDVDLFRVDTSRSGVLSLRWIQLPPVHAPFISWFDGEGRSLHDSRSSQVRVRQGEALYLEVRSQSFHRPTLDVGSTEPVVLVAEILPEPFPGEPNDTPAEAQPIVLGEDVTFAFYPRLDPDHFRIQVPRDGRLVLTWVKVPPGHRPHGQWLDSQGKALARIARPISVKADQVVVLAVQGQLYLVQQVGSLEPVVLRVDLIGPGDEHEPNDTPDKAVSLDPDRPVQAEVSGDDQDWFALVGPLDVRVEMTGVIEVTLHRADGTLAGDGAERMVLRRGERAFLRVTGSSSYGLRLVPQDEDPERDAGLYPRDPPPYHRVSDPKELLNE